MPSLRLVLADQLSPNLASLQDVEKDDVILMAEVRDQFSPVRHHRKKIVFIFSAMRHFAAELRDRGYRVSYVNYDDAGNTGTLAGEIRKHVQSCGARQLLVTEPGEYHLREALAGWRDKLDVPLQILPDRRFIAGDGEFAEWVKGRKKPVMEYWYRRMRRKTGLLMEADKPLGGRWNYDSDNRRPIRTRPLFKGPKHFRTDTTTKQVIKLVDRQFPDHFGEIQPFWFAVTRRQAQQALAHFIKYSLSCFGDYQDAMLTSEAFLYHSVISQYLNCGLLDPLHVCRRVERAYHDGQAPLNAVEGFIRQVIGWREYIRGMYHYHMPEYAELDHMGTSRPLPAFYWHGKTDMKCLAEVVATTSRHACSHHIQRLMVTGNFANLAGISVREVCDWYLAVYADAWEWVELPNTLGMALYADGGIVGTKPYVCSGAYINRMSDFCNSCRYDHRRRLGEDACPFTTLYWHYLIRHEQKLKNNPRMAMAFRNLARLSIEEKKQITKQGDHFLNNRLATGP